MTDRTSQTSSLYSFSQETKDQLRKFRLGTSRAKDPQARICKSDCPSYSEMLQADRYASDMIDNKSQEIKAADEEIYSNMLDLADELPDSSPRFILLSYPLTLVNDLVPL